MLSRTLDAHARECICTTLRCAVLVAEANVTITVHTSKPSDVVPMAVYCLKYNKHAGLRRVLCPGDAERCAECCPNAVPVGA